MNTEKWLGKIGDTLGEARQELTGAEFLVVLGFAAKFTAKMYELETKDSDEMAVKGLGKIAEKYVSEHLRAVGIEL